MATIPIAAQRTDAAQLTVVTGGLNVRSGPGTGYFLLGTLTQGDTVPITGQHSATGWWQIRQPNGISGWVSGSPAFVTLSGDLTAVPEKTAPSLYPALNLLSGFSATVQPSTISAPAPTPTLNGVIVFQTGSGGDIYAINADGSNLHYLTTGLDPALSPDGTQVAFTRWDAGHDGAFGSVWVINLDGDDEHPVLTDLRQPKAPTWSADGSEIAVSMQEGGWLTPKSVCGHEKAPAKAYDIEKFPGGLVCYTLPPDPFWGLRVVNISDGSFRDLPRDDHSISPTWDPANPWRLVYDGDRSLVGVDVTRDTNWPIGNDAADHDPVFSPDGSQLAVSYWQDDHWEIHTMGIDGSNRVRLTETPRTEIVAQLLAGEPRTDWNNTAPAWSPDGESIAFLTDRNGAWEIWVMNRDGSNQRPLLPAGTLDDLTIEYYNMAEQVISWQIN